MSGVLHQEFLERQHGAHGEGSSPEPPWQEAGEIALFYGVPTIVVLLAGIWWLLGKLLTPVTSLTHAAENLQAYSLKARLPLTGRGDELDRFTEVFNSMTQRLDESFTLVREFTLNASHELKTPLTILRGQIETKLHGPTFPTADSEFFGG